MSEFVSEIRGARLISGKLDPDVQANIVTLLRQAAQNAPFFSPSTRWGKKMSVKMTSVGKYGWFSDNLGYRYVSSHPNGSPWPAIPLPILALWSGVTGLEREPDCCLVNFYGEGARMGLHQDNDEADFSFPVVSVSLGDDALFRIGGRNRSDPTSSVWLKSGDVVVLENQSRLAYHGIDKLRFGSSRLLPVGGRINLTMRVVD